MRRPGLQVYSKVVLVFTFHILGVTAWILGAAKRWPVPRRLPATFWLSQLGSLRASCYAVAIPASRPPSQAGRRDHHDGPCATAHARICPVPHPPSLYVGN